MAKAIIHIGMDKTGSTYIQHVCAQIRPELAALGICYPVPRGAVFINHVLFAMAHGFAPHVPATDAQSAAAWDTMAEALPDHGQTLLLSSEHFSHDRSDATIRRLKTWLGAHGYHDVRIVVFLRNQVSWLVSAYGQDIKGGNIKAIGDFYRKRARWMVYSNLLAAWASAFGQDNVTAINYDAARQADRQHGITDALWSAIGIDAASRSELAPRRAVHRNAQPSQVLLEALRRCPLGPALLRQGHDFAVALLGHSCAAMPAPITDTPIWPLPPDFLADLAIMQRDNETIAQAFGLLRLPDLQQAASSYQARIVPVPEREVARCASLVKLGAARPMAAMPRTDSTWLIG